jgi:tetratricopeptide (TPR) repeat protein
MFRPTLLAILLAAVIAPATLGEPPQPATQREQVAELIGQLGDPQFAVRRRAQEQLVKLGFDAFDALVAAQDHVDPEVAMQARYLVRRIRSSWTNDSDPRQIQEIFKEYEILPEEDRRAKINQLAELPADAGLKWLCRLVRFERSPLLSKRAALAIMDHPPADEAHWERREQIMRTELNGSERPAAAWLEVYLQARTDPAGALEAWTRLTDAERETLSRQPQDTHNQIVQALLKREVEMLDALGKSEGVDRVLEQMILAERGDSQSLSELIQWFADRKAWSSIDRVAERFSASFEVDAVLMYTLCEARLAQGQTELAEETAQRALKIHGDSQQEHVLLANRLGDQGLNRWADREWQYAIELGPTGSQWDIIARKLLANSYHDRQEDDKAGKLLSDLLSAAESDNNVMQRIRAAQQQQYETSISQLRSDMYFYQACHAAAQGDVQRQRDLLDESLAQNRSNIEALIALYQITEGDTKRRSRIAEWSKEFIELCRSRIDDDADSPTFYNQIAWLVANTEGNHEEAIALSKRSIELARAQGDPPLRLGGLYDTLAHCYFAKGDYAQAVKTQEEAARLDPHTQSIVRALERFRRALAAQQSK